VLQIICPSDANILVRVYVIWKNENYEKSKLMTVLYLILNII